MAIDPALAASRECPVCGQTEDKEGDPRHGILGGPDYHMDCHAGIGCDLCQEMLDHHGGSVKGKARQLHDGDVPKAATDPNYSLGWRHIPEAGNVVKRVATGEE